MVTIDEAVALQYFGKPTAAKRGRVARFPYVPVIDHTQGNVRQRTEQVLGWAYATREEAVACAQRTIEARREALRWALAEPRMRALRKQHNVEESEVTTCK